MKKAVIFLGSAILLFSTFTVSAHTEDTEQKLTTFLEDSLDMYHIPGASLAIVENGEMIYHHQWGTLSDGSEVTGETPFLLGSLSKPITSLAMMSYLPSFTYQTDSSKPITVFHLLEQTSGISQYEGLKVTDKDRPREGAIHHAVKELSGVPLTHEPGETYEYNSANYLLLGAMVEQVTNQSFSEYVHKNIFAPLDMNNTAADYDTAVAKGFIPGFHSWFGKLVASDGFYDHSGAPYGYIASTTNDLAKFLTFMLEGGDLLSEENLAFIKTPPEEGKTYGLGWHFSKTEHFPFHGGATSDFRGEMFFIPEQNLAAVLLTNKYHIMEDAGVHHIMNGIRSILNGKEPDALPEQSYVIQWSLLGVTLLFTILTIVHFFRLKSKRLVSKKITFTVGMTSLILAGGIIPLFVYFVDTPWKSISFFAPDIAFLTYCLAGILTLNGMLALLSVKPKSYSRRHKLKERL